MKRLIETSVLAELLLVTTSCSSFISRTETPDGGSIRVCGIISRAGAEGGTDVAGQAAGMVVLSDLSLSAVVDTLLLPMDVAWQPEPKSLLKYSYGVFRGTYRFGREISDFTASGSKERWWLAGEIGELTRGMSKTSLDAPPELPNPVFVVVEGHLSEPGRYGHMEYYRRELVVTKVVEIGRSASVAQ